MNRLRYPIVITSLEEDFKEIGLISEDEDDAEEQSTVEESPAKKPTSKLAEDKRSIKRSKVLAEAKKDEDEEDEDDDEADDAEESVDWKDAVDDLLTRVSEAKLGKIRKRRGAKAAKARRKAKVSRRKNKASLKMSRKKRMRKPSTKRRMKKIAKIRKKIKRKGFKVQVSGLDRVADLVEEVKHLREGLEPEVQKDETELDVIESLDLVGEISSLLSEAFDRLDESEYALAFAELAKEVAGLIEKIDGGYDDESDITESFESAVSDLADGLEYYTGLTEGKDEDEDEEEEDEEDEEEDDEEYEDECESTDSDDDDLEEEEEKDQAIVSRKGDGAIDSKDFVGSKKGGSAGKDPTDKAGNSSQSKIPGSSGHENGGEVGASKRTPK